MKSIKNMKEDMNIGNKEFGKGVNEFAFDKVLANEDRMIKV